MTNKDRFVFTLNFSLKEFAEKYGIVNTYIPKNVTSIDLIKDETKESYTFYDDLKNLKQCAISVVTSKKKYCCFWDRHPIEDIPIACPIKYNPNRVRKTYKSEITKEKYSITQCATSEKLKNINFQKDKRYSIDERENYTTEGCFCSFNCLLAFLQDDANRNNPLYKHSYMLTAEIYNYLTGGNLEDLSPAPHWTLLESYGGTLSVKEFRKL